MALPHRSASTETPTETASPAQFPYVMPQPGRPSLFSPERTAASCAIIIKEGISDSAAGALAGVTASTLSRWKQESEEFALELEAARALFELEQIRAIRDARKRDGSPDWRAAAWLLKHSSPEGFGPASRRRKAREMERGSEKGTILPKTPGGQAGARGPSAPAGANTEFKIGAFVPEAPLAGDRQSEQANGAAATPLKNRANLPKTPGNGACEMPKLSRRERRAEERRMAKEARKNGAAEPQ